jgi:2',3'-cyclic-nucleotide 2'-phosphodiesterase (5'-nucleotidase family)
MTECLAAIGVTHVVLGNHEDDVPVAELHQRALELPAVWLGTNVEGFGAPMRSHDVVEVRAAGGASVRVGLVGVVMDDPAIYRAAPFGGARLRPPNEAALEEARRLVASGCASVVAVTHQALAEDRALAKAAGGALVPLVVGGHEHVQHLESVGGTWIVKADMDASTVAVSDLRWDGDGPPQVTVRIEPVAGCAEDPALRALVDRHMAKVHALEGATLLTLPPGHGLSSVGSRVRQTSLGAFVCGRLRDALGADGAIFNGGGIRASRTYEGRLTFGDLKAELPFDNDVVLASLPGRVLAEAIAASRAHEEESPAYLQVDDAMTVEEPGHRLTAVGGVPLDLERTYRIATVRDLLTGMDHIEPLVKYGREHPEAVPPAGSGREIKVLLVGSCAASLWRTLGGFDAVDANHDGRVTEAELAEAVARVAHESPSSTAAHLMVQALDPDHAGAITRHDAELLEPRKKLAPEG